MGWDWFGLFMGWSVHGAGWTGHWLERTGLGAGHGLCYGLARHGMGLAGLVCTISGLGMESARLVWVGWAWTANGLGWSGHGLGWHRMGIIFAWHELDWSWAGPATGCAGPGKLCARSDKGWAGI